MATKAIAELSADARRLINAIGEKKRGDEITWDWMEQLVGWKLREKPSVMTTVKNRLLRDYDYVLGSMPKKGYRILFDSKVVDGEMSKDRERIRKAAGRIKLKARAVDPSNLTEPQRVRLYAEITAAHVTAETSDEKSITKISLELSGKSQPLTLNKALDAIKHNLEDKPTN